MIEIHTLLLARGTVVADEYIIKCRLHQKLSFCVKCTSEIRHNHNLLNTKNKIFVHC